MEMELAICAVSDVTLLLIAWLRGPVAAAIAAAVCPEIPLTWFERAWTSVFWLETDVDIEFAWVERELAVLAFATTLADMATNEMAWAPAGATTKSVASAVMTCLATRRVEEEGSVSVAQEVAHSRRILCFPERIAGYLRVARLIVAQREAHTFLVSKRIKNAQRTHDVGGKTAP